MTVFNQRVESICNRTIIDDKCSGYGAPVAVFDLAASPVNQLQVVFLIHGQGATPCFRFIAADRTQPPVQISFFLFSGQQLKLLWCLPFCLFRAQFQPDRALRAVILSWTLVNSLSSGESAIPARPGLRSTYAMQASRPASSSKAWHLKRPFPEAPLASVLPVGPGGQYTR